MAHYVAIQVGPDKNPARGRVIARGTQEEMTALWVPGEVMLGFVADDTPIRRLSPEGLGRRRRSLLRTRLQKRFPLLADQLEAAELDARRDHYFPHP